MHHVSFGLKTARQGNKMQKLGYAGKVLDPSFSSCLSNKLQCDREGQQGSLHTMAGSFRPRDRPVSAKHTHRTPNEQQPQLLRRPVSALVTRSNTQEKMGGPYAVLLKHKSKR